MIIVAGHLHVAADDRDDLLARSRTAIELARSVAGNLDFVVAADPLDVERVNVYERWTDRASLEAFRGDGPDDQLGGLVVSADIGEFDVLRARPDG